MVFSQKQLKALTRYFDWYCSNAKKQFMETLNGPVIKNEINNELCIFKIEKSYRIYNVDLCFEKLKHLINKMIFL